MAKGEGMDDQEKQSNQKQWILHPRQQANLIRRMQADEKATETRMKARDQKVLAFRRNTWSQFTGEAVMLIVFAAVVWNNWEEYSRLQGTNEELWYALNANMWTIVAKAIVNAMTLRYLNSVNLERRMRNYFVYELLNQGWVMYFVYVVYSDNGVDDLYRLGFNSMTDLILAMLWIRLFAFLVFMISCPLLMEVQQEARDKRHMATMGALPCCGLSFEDFSGHEMEMVTQVPTGHIFKQKALEMWINDRNENCPITGEKIYDFSAQERRQTSLQKARDAGSLLANGELELKYFDLYGRANQLRMALWYCNIKFKDTRVSQQEFGKNKAAGVYPFGSLPVMILPNGEQVAQLQAMLRMVALNGKGMKGETMYPGKADPDDSYKIDRLVELSESWLPKFAFYLNPQTAPQKVGAFVQGDFVKFIERIDEELKANEGRSKNFLVGNSLTIADCSLGSIVLRNVLSPHHPDGEKYRAVAQKYPRVWNWATNTIEATFKDWFLAQPKGELNGAL